MAASAGSCRRCGLSRIGAGVMVFLAVYSIAVLAQLGGGGGGGGLLGSFLPPSPPRFSSHLCKGTVSPRAPLCHFRDVCLSTVNLTIHYYTDDLTPASSNAPPELIEITAGWTDANKNADWHAHLQLLPGPVPSTARYHASPLATVLRLWWAENWGHFLIDNMFATMESWRFFDLEHLASDAQVVLALNGCRSVYPSADKPPQVQCLRFLDELWQPGVGSKRPVLTAVELLEAVAPAPMVCFRHLVVGVATFGMFAPAHGRGIQYWQFRARVLENFNISLTQALAPIRSQSPKHAVLFRKSVGAHRREIINWEQLERVVRQSLPSDHTFEVVDPASLPMREQLLLMQRATFVISPEGGTSMLSFFLRRHAAAVFLSHWSPYLNASVHMEGFFWRTMSWLIDAYYEVEPDEIADVEVDDHLLQPRYRAWWDREGVTHFTPKMSDRAAREELAYRGSFSMFVNTRRLVAVIRSTLLRQQRILRAA